MSDWCLLVGLEVHVRLMSARKIFCNCANRAGAPANTLVCPVCLGLPGAMPRLNRQAALLGVRAALALHAELNYLSSFDRKNYCYRDLPKNYQITQYYEPLARGGYIEWLSGRGMQWGRWPLMRMHLEEDAGRTLWTTESCPQVDFNRAGAPLLEIVAYPRLSTPEEASRAVSALAHLVRWHEVSDARLQDGSLRCDVNVSLVRRSWLEQEGALKDNPARLLQLVGGVPRAEIKNLNSFKAVRLALKCEEERLRAQAEEAWGRGERHPASWNKALTLGFAEERGSTYVMRAKEEAEDYGYMPEPDLPVLRLEAEEVSAQRQCLSESPVAFCERALAQGLNVEQALALGQARSRVSFWNEAGAGRRSALWLINEIPAWEKGMGLTLESSPLRPYHLRELEQLALEKKVPMRQLTDWLKKLFVEGGSVPDLARLRSDAAGEPSLEYVVTSVLSGEAQSVEAYRSGKEKALNFLLGQVMKRLPGADPSLVKAELLRRLQI